MEKLKGSPSTIYGNGAPTEERPPSFKSPPPASLIRLPSFKPPRDLTLGAGAAANAHSNKTVYGSHRARNKNKTDQQEKKKANAKKQRDRRQKNKKQTRPSVIVKSTSVSYEDPVSSERIKTPPSFNTAPTPTPSALNDSNELNNTCKLTADQEDGEVGKIQIH